LVDTILVLSHLNIWDYELWLSFYEKYILTII
jgi:hypothetical protein